MTTRLMFFSRVTQIKCFFTILQEILEFRPKERFDIQIETPSKILQCDFRSLEMLTNSKDLMVSVEKYLDAPLGGSGE